MKHWTVKNQQYSLKKLSHLQLQEFATLECLWVFLIFVFLTFWLMWTYYAFQFAHLRFLSYCIIICIIILPRFWRCHVMSEGLCWWILSRPIIIWVLLFLEPCFGFWELCCLVLYQLDFLKVFVLHFRVILFYIFCFIIPFFANQKIWTLHQ